MSRALLLASVIGILQPSPPARVLLPAGDAWRAAWNINPALQLYGPDRFHPSITGSYLAALVIYRQLFAEPPPVLPMPGLAPADAAVLRHAVENILPIVH